MTMSNRIAVMNRGRLEQLGAPQDVYELPTTEFVASFLGASNLIDGEVVRRDAERAEVRLAPGPVVAIDPGRLPSGATRVRVGVRPEKIRISNTGDDQSGPPNSVAATVEDSTYTGVATTYVCRLDDGTRVVAYVQNVGSSADVVRPGSRSTLSWAPEHTFAVERADRPPEKEGDVA